MNVEKVISANSYGLMGFIGSSARLIGLYLRSTTGIASFLRTFFDIGVTIGDLGEIKVDSFDLSFAVFILHTSNGIGEAGS